MHIYWWYAYVSLKNICWISSSEPVKTQQLVLIFIVCEQTGSGVNLLYLWRQLSVIVYVLFLNILVFIFFFHRYTDCVAQLLYLWKQSCLCLSSFFPPKQDKSYIYSHLLNKRNTGRYLKRFGEGCFNLYNIFTMNAEYYKIITITNWSHIV